VASGSIPCRKYLARDDKRGCVGAEVLEEIAEAIERKQPTGGDLVEAKADNTEKNRQHDEPANLDRLASDSVDRRHRNPVAGNETSHRENEIADAIIIQSIISLDLV